MRIRKFCFSPFLPNVCVWEVGRGGQIFANNNFSKNGTMKPKFVGQSALNK